MQYFVYQTEFNKAAFLQNDNLSQHIKAKIFHMEAYVFGFS